MNKGILIAFKSEVYFSSCDFGNISAVSNIFEIYDSVIHIDFLKISYSFIELENFSLMKLVSSSLFSSQIDIQYTQINSLAFINLIASNASIENLYFSNILIVSQFTFFSFEDLTQGLTRNHFNLYDLLFYNISGFSSDKYCFEYLIIYGSFIDVYLKNSKFKKIGGYSHLILIEAFSSSILVENSYFINNLFLSNIKIITSKNVTFNNVTCLNNNKRSNMKNEEGNSCFIILNADGFIFSESKILNCLSLTTSSGLIIKNDEIQENSHSKILIINCFFISNNAEITSINEYSGGVIKIITKSNFFLINSKFYNNILFTHLSKKNNKIGGPCLYIISSKNVLVDNSYFKENRSLRDSNCIVSVCNIMRVNNSYFHNNTILSLNNEFFLYLKTSRECAEGIDFILDSKGGAIFFKGMILFIGNTYFTDNKANEGSAIFLFNNENSQEIMVIKIYTCVFLRNQAVFASLIALKPFLKTEYHFENCVVSQNLACYGALMQIELKYLAKLKFLNNQISFNLGNIGTIFYHFGGPCIFINSNNTFYENQAKAVMGTAGGTIYIFTANSLLFSENEIYYRNICYQGVISQFSSFAYQKNCFFINNFGLQYFAIGTLDLASYFGENIYFLNGQAIDFGAILISDSSQITIGSCIFFNGSSKNRASAILLQLFSRGMIYNCTFLRNNMNEINIVELQQNEASIIFQNCTFIKNVAISKFFDIVNSYIILINNIFLNNEGKLLEFSEGSVGNLINITISFSQNSESLIQISDKCLVEIKYINISKSSSIYGCFIIEFSFMKLENANLNEISFSKNGSLVKSYNSELLIDTIHMKNYEGSAIYLEFSNISISKSIFNNFERAFGHKVSKCGSICIFHCRNVLIRNSTFINSKNIVNGGGIYLDGRNENGTNLIENCYFYLNIVINFGGAIFVDNSKLKIKYSIFKLNQAIKGGSIYYGRAIGKYIIFLKKYANNF